MQVNLLVEAAGGAAVKEGQSLLARAFVNFADEVYRKLAVELST